ncbi:ThiF family adenylyltransferase [Sorangium sp. So ce269]
MSPPPPSPSEELRAGRRALDGIPGVKTVEDLVWHAESSRWLLRVRITIDVSPVDPTVHVESDWFVHIHGGYPLGRIKLYPAKDGGIGATFPHQSYNADIGEVPWRSGDLCLDSPYRAPLGRSAPEQEPSDPDWRLWWHVSRAKDWLENAAAGTLLRPEDPYELPPWPPGATDTATVVFSESGGTFELWSASGEGAGLAEIVEIMDGYRAVVRWTDFKGVLIREVPWGDAIVEGAKRRQAVWFLLPDVPKLPPWQGPRTWGGFRRAVRFIGLDDDRLLRKIVHHVRGRESCVLLVGFPIPERVNLPAREIWWKCIELPASMTTKAPKDPGRSGKRRPKPARRFHSGFRDNALGRWMLYVNEALRNDASIQWAKSDNWHQDRIGARGRYMDSLRLARVSIIGVGALGSAVADLLVRGGTEDLLIIDGDEFAVGNLVRHRLNLDAVGHMKADAMKDELNLASPHAKVKAFAKALPLDPEERRRVLDDRQIILDCTGEDEPLSALANDTWETPKLFVSMSVGYEARRLFYFSAYGQRFPLSEYVASVEPWLMAQREPILTRDLPREGPGCWHPAWPGRLDDILLMAAIASKLLESDVGTPPATPALQVFERQTGQAGMIEGVRRVRALTAGEPA